MIRPAPWMIGLAGALLAAGCDFSDMQAPAVPAECQQIGQHCQLATGPIGVCLDAPCKTGQTPPCFACTPQH